LGWQCPGCESLTWQTVPRHRCTREAKLCDRIDTGLLGMFPRRGVRWYESISKSIAVGHAVATSIVETTTCFPTSGEALVEFSKRCHRVVFQAWPEGSGEFRTEPGYFGFGVHEREGVEAEQIPSVLMELGDEYGFRFANAGHPDVLALTCASFLYRFFEVHPFPDGNGRVGRLLLRLGAKANGFELAWHQRMSQAARRKYINALRYADRNSDMTPSDKRAPLGKLTAWMAAALHPRIDAEGEFANALGSSDQESD